MNSQPPRLKARRLGRAACLASATGALLLACAARAEVQLYLSGPRMMGPIAADANGRFEFADVPLRKNSADVFTVTAVDESGNRMSRDIRIAQLSVEEIVVSQVTTEPLSPEEIEQLVNDGVIALDDPDNYNVSRFSIVLTIDEEPYPISVPIVFGAAAGGGGGGFETYRLPKGDDGAGRRDPQPVQIIVFEEPIPSPPDQPDLVVPPIPGVIVIDGSIRSLKEFFSVRLMLMNVSGIFTLSNVVAEIEFPDGGLSSTLPRDGLMDFGHILPGTSEQPGQVEREFIVRGDAIGVRGVKLNYGGVIVGPGIASSNAIPFNGSALGEVEVKGPPEFRVRVTHPDVVSNGVPYELIVEIENVGEIPALYTSLDLDVGAQADLVECTINTNTGLAACEVVKGIVTRTLGHLLPGLSVRETYKVLPRTSGRIGSCMAIADQNIALRVYVGNLGCVAGQYPVERGSAGGEPTVAVAPAPNAQGISVDSPVTAFFSDMMATASIWTGSNGTFNVYNSRGALVPGRILFHTLSSNTVAIWQVDDGVSNRLGAGQEYSVAITGGIRGTNGLALYNEWYSTFRTTTMGLSDVDPPLLTLSVDPPTDPNYILPGEMVTLEAYAADQGSGIARVELRVKDLDGTNLLYELVDTKVVFRGDKPPYLFALDSAKMTPGHIYQALATAFDTMGNFQNATVSLVIAPNADPPVLVLPDPPALPQLQGISVTLRPTALTGGVRRVAYFLDDATNAYKTVTLPPYQATLSTLALALTNHSIRAVAVDGLGQTGEDTYDFLLVENLNMPVITFPGAVSGATYVQGDTLIINPRIEDDVGLRSVHVYVASPETNLVTDTSQPVVIDTRALALGTHHVYVVATNNLGIGNAIGDADTFLEFSIVEPPPGPPPPAPVVALSYPDGGVVAFRGRAVAGARIDVENVGLPYGTRINADAGGAFSGDLPAAAGDQLSFVAWDLANSPSSSVPTVVTVQNPPVLVALETVPVSVTFTAAGQWRDLVVQGTYTNVLGTWPSNVTSRATFASDQPSVASVNAAGRVVGLSRGTATITVSVGAREAACPVNANIVALTNLTISPNPVELVAIGETVELAVTGLYNDGTTRDLTRACTYACSDVDVVRAESSGRLTAVGDGAATLAVYHTGLVPVALPVSVNSGNDPAPTAEIVSPVAGARVEAGDTLGVTVRCRDVPTGVAGVGLSVRGAFTYDTFRQVAPPEKRVTPVFSIAVPDTLSDGQTFDVSAWAVDTSGNTSAVATVNLSIVDESAPTLHIAEPAPETPYAYGSTLRVTVAAADAAGIASVRCHTTGAFVVDELRNLAAHPHSTNAVFVFAVPYGLADPDVTIHAEATDVTGHRGMAADVPIVISDADVAPPVTVVRSVSNPGAGTTATVGYEVLDGLDDLDHVEIFFRRDGLGTFNRYTDAAGGNPYGRFVPRAGAMGTLTFDSARMGGDGRYEFYSVGVDARGNRESAPLATNGLVAADATGVFAAGTVWTTVTTNRTLTALDTSLEDRNVRIDGATVTIDGHHAFRNLELVNGAVLTHPETTTNAEYGIDLSAWTVTIDSNSVVNVDARGYLGGNHDQNANTYGMTVTNSPGSMPRSAGSYGGEGARESGTPCPLYGNLAMPTDLGSGGSWSESYYRRAGGDGGGRVRLAAINLVVEGRMTAGGGVGGGANAGSGSGGSVYLVLATLSGDGSVSADGGGGQLGGGGGRVAVHYVDVSTYDIGGLSALGGQGSTADGGNGTVYLQGVAEGGTLIVDGQGIASSFSALPIPPGFVFDNVIIRNSARVIVDDPLVVSNRLQILGDSILTHSLSYEPGLAIRARRVEIDSTSKIDVSSKGYRGGNRDGNGATYGMTLGGQPGAAQRAGGSYGGYGGVQSGAGSNPPYGTPDNPVWLGSGGSWSESYYQRSGGNGGGRVTIEAETIAVDGAIAADGGTGNGVNAGSGSGGSVLLRTSLLRGTGRISADGGAGDVGGGGGRVAVYYDYVGQSGNDLDDLRSVTAFGGRGSTVLGSAGTLMMVRHDQTYGDLYVDAQVTNGETVAWTPLTPLGFAAVARLTNDTLWVGGSAHTLLPGGLVGMTVNPNVEQAATFTVVANTATSLTVDVSGGTDLLDVGATGATCVAVYRFDNVYFRRSGFLVCGDRLVVGGTVRIAEDGVLTHYDATDAFASRLDLHAGTLEVAVDGALDVSRRGYPGGQTDGNAANHGITLGFAAGATQRSSGSYGGLGSAESGQPNDIYGSLTEPAELGSGGSWSESYYRRAGGDGGGCVHIVAGTLRVDGVIAADGGPGNGANSGSGSGGAIFVEAGVIDGSGTITANGGGGEWGGGGGRVALHATSLTLDTANVQVLGGRGSQSAGGNGTLFVKRAGAIGGDLIVDGRGNTTPSDLCPLPGGYTFDNIILRHAADVVADAGLTVRESLRIETGSRLRHTLEHEPGLDVTADSVVIDASSAIDVSSRGYRGGYRDGNGQTYGLTLGGLPGARQRAGGSYGGLGGIESGAGLNPAYGHPAYPVQLGSGGSWSESYYQRAGGNGGGRVTIKASGSVTVDGAILAEGGTGGGRTAGSGSGGAIRIDTDVLRGAGRIAADGGGGQVGGGGGRVAVRYASLGAAGYDLDGTRSISAFGGRGSTVSGSAGTVMLIREGQVYGDLYVDDNFTNQTSGVWTPLTHLSFGCVTALSSDTLGLDGKVYLLPNALVGIEVNPNIDQSRTFTVLSNTETSLVVDTSGGTNLTDVAVTGGTYCAVYRFDNVELRRGGFMVAGDRLRVTETMHLTERGVLTHYEATTNFESRLDVTVGTLAIESNAQVNVTGRGYLGGLGGSNPNSYGMTLGNRPGAQQRAGGSYGGYGAVESGGGSNPPYGDPRNPVALGSGGSWSDSYYRRVGGDGGGRVFLTAGDVRVDGAILANGADGGGNAGSGSGGSIRIVTGLLRGTGTIVAGGGGNDIGGGGGRVAIRYAALGAAGDDLDGLRGIVATGGRGSNCSGSAGTVVLIQEGQRWGDLYVDDAQSAGVTAGVWTPLTPIGFGAVRAVSSDTLQTDGRVPCIPGGLVGLTVNPNMRQRTAFTIVGNTTTTLTVDVSGGTNLTDVAAAGDTYGGIFRFDNVYFRRGGFLVMGDRLEVLDALHLDEAGVLTHYDATDAFESRLDVRAGHVTIGTNAAIDVGLRGYPGGNTAGNGATWGLTTNRVAGSTQRSAGSYGGLGAANTGTPNPVYGDEAHPAELGSGGSWSESYYRRAGGDGGGWLALYAGSLQVDGRISADGGPGGGHNAGSGSGGSIYIESGALSGVGLIRANGGNDLGGGGGRVALYFPAAASVTNGLSITALGGTGPTASGQRGTVYVDAGYTWTGTPAWEAEPDYSRRAVRDARYFVTGVRVVGDGRLVVDWYPDVARGLERSVTTEGTVIEFTPDLVNPDWQPVVFGLSGNSWTGAVPVTAGHGFLRIRETR